LEKEKQKKWKKTEIKYCTRLSRINTLISRCDIMTQYVLNRTPYRLSLDAIYSISASIDHIINTEKETLYYTVVIRRWTKNR
jgi:hypothetical protein